MANRTVALFGLGTNNLVSKADLLPLQEQIRDLARDKRKEIQAAKAAGTLTAEEIELARFDLAMAHRDGAATVIAEIDGLISEHQERWQEGRSPAQEAGNLQRWAMAYSNMSAEAVGSEVERYERGPAGFDPDEVRALHAATHRTGQDVAAMERIMDRADYARPWLRDCPDLTRLRQMYDLPFGEARVVSVDGVETVALADLLADDE